MKEKKEGQNARLEVHPFSYMDYKFIENIHMGTGGVRKSFPLVVRLVPARSVDYSSCGNHVTRY
jgi:hypothetical protein